MTLAVTRVTLVSIRPTHRVTLAILAAWAADGVRGYIDKLWRDALARLGGALLGGIAVAESGKRG